MKALCDVDENQRSLPKYSVNRQNNYGSPCGSYLSLSIFMDIRIRAIAL